MLSAASAREWRSRVGMVVPVWFSPTMAPETMRDFVTATLQDVEVLAAPRHVVLVVDGCPRAEAPTQTAAAALAARSGEEPVVLQRGQNEGKGGAVCRGLEHLLAHSHVTRLCVRDCDNDHSIWDLPRLVELADHISAAEGTERLFVVGGRSSVHHPLGNARGEHETVLNRVTRDAVAFALAREGRAPETKYLGLVPAPTLYPEGVPDLQSGYKLYTRETAPLVIESLRRAHREDPDAGCLRWGAEFMAAVELYLAGAIAGQAPRTTYDQQPQTTFDESDMVGTFGVQIAWLLRRLAVPLQPATAWLDGAVAASWWRTSPRGADELLRLRRTVLQAVYGDPQAAPEPSFPPRL